MTVGIEQFRQVSRILGLEVEDRSNALQGGRLFLRGRVEGLPVVVELWRGDFIWFEFNAFFEPPADLHLSIKRAGVAAKVAGLLGRHDIDVGDPAFDAAWTIKAHEPERARALLSPAVREALMGWQNAGDLFAIDDECVSLSVRSGAYTVLDTDTIVNDIRATVGLARVLSHALRDVPPSTAIADHVQAWRDFAEAHGLAFSQSPLRMSGMMKSGAYRTTTDVPLVARAVPMGKDGYGVELRVRVGALPCHLRVRPAHWYDVVERTGDASHVKTGDSRFDEVLRVTADDPDAARRVLRDEVRAEFLAFTDEHLGIALEDGELQVRTKSMLAPADFPVIAEHAEKLARLLTS